MFASPCAKVAVVANVPGVVKQDGVEEPPPSAPVSVARARHRRGQSIVFSTSREADMASVEEGQVSRAWCFELVALL